MHVTSLPSMKPVKDNENGTLNPFRQEHVDMGTYLGTNVCVMYRNSPDQGCPYLIIIDTVTGERIKVSGFQTPPGKK